MGDEDKRSWMQRAEEDDVTVPYIGYIAFSIGLGLVAEGWMERDFVELVVGVVLTALGAIGVTQPPQRPRDRSPK